MSNGDTILVCEMWPATTHVQQHPVFAFFIRVKNFSTQLTRPLIGWNLWTIRRQVGRENYSRDFNDHRSRGDNGIDYFDLLNRERLFLISFFVFLLVFFFVFLLSFLFVVVLTFTRRPLFGFAHFQEVSKIQFSTLNNG
jgi:hypothetical protein